MNRKILVVSILAVFTLVAISFASAINTTTPVKRKESPLYGIRTRRAIGERLGKIIDYIKTRFLGDRIFFLPFEWLRNKMNNNPSEILWKLTDGPWSFCHPTSSCTPYSSCYPTSECTCLITCK